MNTISSIPSDPPDDKPPTADELRARLESRRTKGPFTRAPAPPPSLHRPSRIIPREKFRRPGAQFPYPDEVDQGTRAKVMIAIQDAHGMDPQAGTDQVMAVVLECAIELGQSGVWTPDQAEHWIRTLALWCAPTTRSAEIFYDSVAYREALKVIATAWTAGPPAEPTVPPADWSEFLQRLEDRGITLNTISSTGGPHRDSLKKIKERRPFSAFLLPKLVKATIEVRAQNNLPKLSPNDLPDDAEKPKLLRLLQL